MATTTIAGVLLLFLLSTVAGENPPPTPAPWPHQFHSIRVMNFTATGALSFIHLWYDWTNGRNMNIIQDQLGGPPLYDVEWNNGTSFFYTLAEPRSCRTAQLDVGILRPNWLDGATYLGQEYVDGFLCNVWDKVEFLLYYEDVATKRPVRWLFSTGRSTDVMTFEVGVALEDEKWQAPIYCFNGEEEVLSASSMIPYLVSRDHIKSSLQNRANTAILQI